MRQNTKHSILSVVLALIMVAIMSVMLMACDKPKDDKTDKEDKGDGVTIEKILTDHKDNLKDFLNASVLPEVVDDNVPLGTTYSKDNVLFVKYYFPTKDATKLDKINTVVAYNLGSKVLLFADTTAVNGGIELSSFVDYETNKADINKKFTGVSTADSFSSEYTTSMVNNNKPLAKIIMDNKKADFKATECFMLTDTTATQGYDFDKDGTKDGAKFYNIFALNDSAFEVYIVAVKTFATPEETQEKAKLAENVVITDSMSVVSNNLSLVGVALA